VGKKGRKKEEGVLLSFHHWLKGEIGETLLLKQFMSTVLVFERRTNLVLRRVRRSNWVLYFEISRCECSV
jgi:hypothetical protein